MHRTALATGALAVISAPAALAQSTSISINLAGVHIQNNLNQTRSSAPATIVPAFKYHYVVSGMVHGSGGVLGIQFPTSTSLATVMETLAPGSSSALAGDFLNCSGQLPIVFPPQTQSGSQDISGITVNYALTLGFQIDGTGIASFSLTNVVLTPTILVGSLVFDSGSAALTKVYVCPANCDGSTSVPVLNFADFSCFLQKFAAGDPTTNCDCSTAEPTLNVADFTCFLQKYATDCPPQ
jgi:hypothetical protein